MSFGKAKKSVPAPTKAAATGDKSARIAALIADIEREFGSGSVMHGKVVRNHEDSLSTGSLALDIATGIGGLPRGRIIEIYGGESSGKTSLCLEIVAQAQRNGGLAAYVDMEQAIDPEWASRIGVNMEDLYISQPDSGEDGLKIVEKYVASGLFDVVVVDSVAALTPAAEINGEMGDSHVGLLARLMAQGLRKLTSQVAKTKTILIFVNQVRDKIGGMSFGPQTETPGGRSLKFFASMRMEVARISTRKVGDVSVANEIRVKFKKNKVAAPYTEANMVLRFGGLLTGISLVDELMEYALEHKIVEKRGAFYRLDDELIGQGEEKALEYIAKDKRTLYDIHQRVLLALGMPALSKMPVYKKSTAELQEEANVPTLGDLLEKPKRNTKAEKAKRGVEDPIGAAGALGDLDLIDELDADDDE